MATSRFWTRRAEPQSSPYEPTPYCDRLTLAERFSDDEETRANGEDRRSERIRVVEAATSFIGLRSPQ